MTSWTKTEEEREGEGKAEDINGEYREKVREVRQKRWAEREKQIDKSREKKGEGGGQAEKIEKRKGEEKEG